MKRLLLALGLLVATALPAAAQSNPGLYYGQVPTAAQWNSYFAAKQDVFLAKSANMVYAGPVSGGAAVPTFRSLVIGDMPSIGANTVIANVTGSSATPTAASLPSCPDTGGNRLNYVSASGFVCGTGTTGTVTSVALTMPGVFSVAGSPITSSGTLAVTANGTSGGVPYFNAANTMASSAALAANQIVLGGGAGAAPATLGSLGTSTQVLHGNAAGAPTWSAISLTADVSGILPVANGGTGLSAGTSGGVPYYSASGTIASSAALTANAPVIGGGAGVAPSVGTKSGNTTVFVTTTGAQTSGNCVSIDANGNHIASGGACGGFNSITTVQRLTSGTGATYTPTAGTQYIRVTIKGGGGGGSGSGSTGPNVGGTGGTTTFNGVTAIGGTGGTSTGSTVRQGGNGGTGGSDNSLVVARRPGASGLLWGFTMVSGTTGAYFGGPGGGAGGGAGGARATNTSGGDGVANSGGGGGGGGVAVANFADTAGWYLGVGGGEGETAVFWLASGSYTYTVGAGGTAGGAGTSGFAGGAGGTGVIFVEEFH